LLFGDEVLSQRERLQIAAVTTLFTDITGSTQMYERLGDALAYNIVRDHFDILFQSIEDQGGRIVKTIGDAVMASFITSQQAIKSIVEFLDGIERYNKSREDNKYVYLKIGVHRGPAILVNLNGSLDYFGSTINKAARIQGLSGSCQITFSEEIYHDEASLSIFEEAGMHHFTRHTVNLKGIEGEQTVYKVSCKEFDTRQNQRESFLVTLRDLFKLK
jgi:class 3 adenylate cyclase